ncbi:MAG: fibronectin type III domain-containing protein [Eubacterium sp.]|nr:fibronectin type III domain-containing protein [Eubacterium sp.]
MKKVLSLTLALMMLIMSISATFTAQAKSTPEMEELADIISGASDYVVANSDMAKISYVDFYTLVDAGIDYSAYENDYAERVKNNYDAYKTGSESDIKGIYEVAAIILALREMGNDPADFYGRNFVELFESFNVSVIDNPYCFRLAMKAAAGISFANTIANAFIKNYYVMGSGVNYWGFSSDNTGMFLAALACVADNSNYAKYIADACSVLKTYTVEGGVYGSEWTPNANTDSTALTLAGFASVLDAENAYNYYKMLVMNFHNPDDGSFAADYDPVYATKDALIGLNAYRDLVKQDIHSLYAESIEPVVKASFDNNGVAEGICKLCGRSVKFVVYAIGSVTISNTSYTYNGKAKKPVVTVKDTRGNVIDRANYSVVYKNNTKPGTGKVTVTFKNLYQGSAAKTFKINVAPTTLSSVSAGSKSFTAKINKLSDAKITGYQIQYGTSSSFKDATKKSTTKTSITVKKLKAKKKYYVRVRAYRTIDGKRYYSAWSAKKTVTTKK